MRPKAKHKLELDRNREAFTQTAKKQWQKSANYTTKNRKSERESDMCAWIESERACYMWSKPS